MRDRNASDRVGKSSDRNDTPAHLDRRSGHREGYVRPWGRIGPKARPLDEKSRCTCRRSRSVARKSRCTSDRSRSVARRSRCTCHRSRSIARRSRCTCQPIAICGPEIAMHQRPIAICGPEIAMHQRPIAICGPEIAMHQRPIAICGPEIAIGVTETAMHQRPIAISQVRGVVYRPSCSQRRGPEAADAEACWLCGPVRALHGRQGVRRGFADLLERVAIRVVFSGSRCICNRGCTRRLRIDLVSRRKPVRPCGMYRFRYILGVCRNTSPSSGAFSTEPPAAMSPYASGFAPSTQISARPSERTFSRFSGAGRYPNRSLGPSARASTKSERPTTATSIECFSASKAAASSCCTAS